VTDPRAGHEAARLLAAAQDWLRTSAPHLAPVADDGEPCSCPVCRAVAGLREADPDAVGRWVDTAVATLGSLVAQAGDLAAKATTAAEDADGYDETDTDETDTDEADADEDVADAGDDEAPDAMTPAEQAPDGGDERQDGPAPRRVRRIPLEPQDDDPGRQDR
jgi:hypothetical protein